MRDLARGWVARRGTRLPGPVESERWHGRNGTPQIPPCEHRSNMNYFKQPKRPPESRKAAPPNPGHCGLDDASFSCLSGRTCADGCGRRRSASILATTFHYAATRRITEIGLLVALVGGLVIALGSSRRTWVGLGGLLIAVGSQPPSSPCTSASPPTGTAASRRPARSIRLAPLRCRSTICGCATFLSHRSARSSLRPSSSTTQRKIACSRRSGRPRRAPPKGTPTRRPSRADRRGAGSRAAR